jgi:tetratricopeptide (TPR) repeat protein
VALFLCATAPAGALASESAKREARALADVAQARFDAGRYEEAAMLFEQAEERYHAPTLLVAAGRAHARLGRLRRALDRFNRVLGEQLDPQAPAEFRQAQREALLEREAIERSMPRLVVEVAGEGAAQTRLDIDGVPARAGEAMALDPGPHEVRARAGSSVAVRRVSLAPSERATVTLELAAQSSASPNAEAGAGGIPVASIVAFGVGGAALVLGTVTGALALGEAASLKQRCPGDRCAPEDRSSQEDAYVLADISTASLVVAGVGVAAGFTIWIVAPRDDPAPSARVQLGPMQLGFVVSM